MIRTFAIALLFPVLAAAQSMHIVHVSNGLDATSARIRLERGGIRPYGPRFEAAGMRASPAMEFFPGLKVPGQRDSLSRPVPLIRIVKPSFRLPDPELGIASTQDVIFFAEHRAVHFRIYLEARGESLAKRWTTQLRKYFEYLDRDDDGILNRYEAEYAFATNGVVQMIRAGFAYQRPDDVVQTFIDMDVDSDGQIRFDEFAAYYAPAASRIVTSLNNRSQDPYADALTDELFKLFDQDKDGRLSRNELNSVERLFRTLDSDEDECLSALELTPGVFNPRTPRPRRIAGPEGDPMLAFEPGAAPEGLAKIMLTRYDSDKNGLLSRKENPFSDEQFASLDADRNGELTAGELARYAESPPDLEIDLTIGIKQEESRIRLRSNATRNPLNEGFKHTGDGGARFTVGTQTVQLGCYVPTGVYNPPIRVLQLGFPDKGKGYLMESDIAGPQFQGLRVLFDLIDRDADGRMSRAEYDRFFGLQKSFTSLPLTLVYSAQTPSLFQFLDSNSDGRLSVREVRTSWDRLIALEPKSKDKVSRAALTPRGSIRFGRSNDVVSSNTLSMYTQTPKRASTKGPLWFRKFDRNADSELSRNEFPGSQADFDRLDRDGDGYISLEEAEQADKELRTKK